ncbi:tetratricopeptide repeat protein [Aestuariibaculum suncheonense]|uniref:Tetratricopeptide repeat protein n=1 Tax=Aestuariibaculum suncheonense TaxID=1028745 RepID=A0A8J6UKH1_9FLAO|nr:tetratricopeptide repeat protein [Aestuariibaculum suncheonense]MBD0835696.1 tetratricopeptide repeat protein [Aestuariibaculum suncheonense]
MKKQIIVALAFSVGAFSFAQKKELKAAEKAIKGTNYAEAKSALKQVEAFMPLEDKYKADYYYLYAQSLYAGGAGSLSDIDEAIKSLGKIEGSLSEESTELKQQMINSLLTKGNEAYEGNDYTNASQYFEKAYRLSPKDTTFLYYAAATAINVPDYDRALSIYEELRDLGYTGVKTEYYATNAETKKEETFENKNMRDISVKAKSHTNPGERTTESKKPEIVKNIAIIYVNKGDNEKAIEAMAAAKAESPNDVNLILTEANVHYKMGNTEKFKALLEQATKMDPSNPELQYNLGVIASESGENEQAKGYYEKTIELDPNYVNAYINLSALVLSKEEGIIKEMNGLGSSKKDDLRYDELRQQRQDLYREAVPYLEKALTIDGENVNAAKTLMNIYSILGETAKKDEMKAKVDAIEAGN